MILGSILENDIHNFQDLRPNGWLEIVSIYKYYMESSFCYPIKATLDERIVGIGAVILFGKTAWLAHIIVRPEYRRKGIGRKIVIELLSKAKEFGCATVSLIATDLGRPVYQNAGFIEQTEYVFLKREKPWDGYIRPASISAFSLEYQSDILSLDKSVSGEDRSRILVDNLPNSFVCQRNGEISGYYLPKLGEGLIIADDVESGIEFMKMKYALSNKAVLPVDNIMGVNFLRNNGFVEILRVKRMVWGRGFLWHPNKIYSRIAGNLG